MQVKLVKPIVSEVYYFRVKGASIDEIKIGVPTGYWGYSIYDNEFLSSSIDCDLDPEIIDGQVYYEIDFGQSNAVTIRAKLTAEQVIELIKLEKFIVQADPVQGTLNIVPM